MRAKTSRRVPSPLAEQKRQAEHAAPGLPFGDDFVSIGGREQRQRQSRIGVFKGDGNDRRQLAAHAIQPDRDAAIGGDRKIHSHPHAGKRAAHHHAFAMQIDDA